MNVRPDQRVRIARLVSYLTAGERIAERCARWQADRSEQPSAHRFLRAQAKQEAFHAQLFDKAHDMLAPRGAAPKQRHLALYRFQRRLEASMARSDLTDTLVGQQIVLEGLGEVILRRLDQAMSRHALGLSALRRILLRQEHAHHVFGIRQLKHHLLAYPEDLARLQSSAASYLRLANGILDEAAPLIGSLDEDPATYSRDLARTLPTWATGGDP